jgi:sorting and assembly machinery component 37
LSHNSHTPITCSPSSRSPRADSKSVAIMLELHVWGPAFGLPSLDAHCLAAIAYLQQAVPRGKWQLIASCNPALSPTSRHPARFSYLSNTDADELPALRNGLIWIGGFRNIFHYLAQCSAGEWVLDAGLPEQGGADCIAYVPALHTQLLFSRGGKQG